MKFLMGIFFLVVCFFFLSPSGTYGTKGAGTATTRPGARSSASTWVAEGFLWLFGGIGYTDYYATGNWNKNKQQQQ
jgi:hypothetical protein